MDGRAGDEKHQPGTYAQFVDSIFATTGMTERVSDAFFPAELRNLFLDAGSQQRLVRLTYDGYERIVEPYALSYKRPSDGFAREYFYVWDRTGGASGMTGIKSLVNPKVQNPVMLEETFQPRFEVELSKAGEVPDKTYFGGGRPSAVRQTSLRQVRVGSRSRPSAYFGGPFRVVQCLYCGKQFKRKTDSLALKKHKDKRGYDCFGRTSYFVGWDS